VIKCIVLGTNLYFKCHSGIISRHRFENAPPLHIKCLSCHVHPVSQNKKKNTHNFNGTFFHFSSILTLRNIMITVCILGLMSKNSTFSTRSVLIFSASPYNKYPVFSCTTLADWALKCLHSLCATRYDPKAI
jgi:hypothetical protein